MAECLACTMFLYSDDTTRAPLTDDCHVPSRHSHLPLHSQCSEVALVLCSLNIGSSSGSDFVLRKTERKNSPQTGMKLVVIARKEKKKKENNFSLK